MVWRAQENEVRSEPPDSPSRDRRFDAEEEGEDEDEEVEVDNGDNLQDDSDDFSKLPVGLYSPLGSEVDTDIATAKKKLGFKGTRKVRGPLSIFTTH